MAKARIQLMPWNLDGEPVLLPAYWCVVCKHPHSIPTKGMPVAPRGWKDRWTWNGDVDKPTFHPSVRTYWTRPQGRYFLLKRNGVFLCVAGSKQQLEFPDLDAALKYAAAHAADNGGQGWGAVQRNHSGAQVTVCHVHVREGMLQVCSDTPGPLAGKTVPLPEWDVDEYRNPKRSEE